MATPIPENRAPFTTAEVARATGGRLVGAEPGLELRGVTTDSRTAPAGSLFVALRGESHDGHRFVPAARERGAFPLVAEAAGVAGPRLEVADTLTALGDLARAHVDRVFAAGGARPVLAIGGAAGKTTTRTLAAAAVGALFGETLVTEGNLNNRVGVPATLLTLAARHRALVLECGTSLPGEIAELGRIARPDVAVVINVGIEHSERLGGLAEIADEEAELLYSARRAAVTNAGEPLLLERLARAGAPRRLTFGSGARADLRLTAREVGDDGRARLAFRLGERLHAPADDRTGTPPARELELTTALLGEQAAENVAAALCGALALLEGTPDARQLAALAAAIAAIRAVPGRLRPLEAGGVLILDDTYNSNPKSVAAALATARELARRRGTRLVLALGDMLELGELSAPAHEEMVRRADGTGASRLLLVGPASCEAAARLRLATETRLFADSAAAAAEIAALVAPDDLLLIKGSRGIRMERLLEALAAPRD